MKINWLIKNKKFGCVFEYTQDKTLSYVKTPYIHKEFYVGRPSVFGNPYSHLQNSLAQYRVKTVQDAIFKYEEIYLPTIENELQVLKNDISTYAMQDALTSVNICLSCFCVPRPCHAFCILKALDI